MSESAKPNQQSLPVPVTSTYQEGGHMLRHYSAMRGSLVTFLISISLLLGGWALTSLNKSPVIYYLLAAEVVVFIMACFASLFFSSNLYHTRVLLTAVESGEQVNFYTRLSLFQLRHYIRLDTFDWLLLVGGGSLHCGVVLSALLGAG